MIHISSIASHEIIEEIRIPVLITAGLHIFRTEYVVVCMVFLPLKLLPFPLLVLFLFPQLLAYLSFVMSFFPEELIFLGPKVRVFLNASLVESVDDGVLSLAHQNLADKLGVMEGDLTSGHRAILGEV